MRHGESKGNVDESEYTRTPDSQVRLTARGHAQAESTGRRLRKMMDEDESEYKLFFYISPYRRSKETAIGIAKAFERNKYFGRARGATVTRARFRKLSRLRDKTGGKARTSPIRTILLSVPER